jgi:putative Mn2+ efflux pump MntP
MFSLETTLLGVALALDAAVASFALGVISLENLKKEKLFRGVVTCLAFGFCQGLMNWLGSLGGYFLTFSSYGHLFQLIVSLIFLILSLRFLQASFSGEKSPIEWGFLSIIVLAFATSTDALLAGVSMGPLPMAHITSIEIGVITTLICSAAYSLSFYFKTLPTQWLLRLASGIFFFLGGRIFIEYF